MVSGFTEGHSGWKESVIESEERRKWKDKDLETS